MADFYQILKNAIADTGAASAAERQMLYQRARAALDGQLANFDPPLPDDARQAQYDRLGEAIGKLEEEASIAAKGTSANVEHVAMPPGKPPAPRKDEPKPEPQPLANGKAQAPLDAKGVAAKAATAKKAVPTDKAPPGAASGERKSLAGTPQAGSRKVGGLGAIAAALVGVALLAGGGWYAVQSGLFGSSEESAPPPSLEPKKVAVEPITPAVPATEPEPAQTPPAAAQTTPSTAQVEPVAPAQPETTPAPVDEPPAQPETAAAPDDPNKDQERVPQAGTASIGEKASFVIEEPNANGPPQETRLDGSASWELSGTGDDATLIFRSTIPARGATFEMTMRKNSDAGLPASHVIEFVFSATGDNPDGQVKSIPGMLMRDKENEAGTPLRGAGAQIVPGQYLIGLSSTESDIKHNLSALADGRWVAVPALMENGKRALFLVEKGANGQDAVDRALAEWKQAP